MMKHITSRSNPLVKHVVDLHDSKHRKAHQQCFAEGLRVCTTLIEQGWKAKTVFIDAAHQSYIHHFDERSIIMVDTHVMEKMSAAESPSGVLCVFDIPPQKPSSELTPGIVLHTISDPGNMGTIIRTAAAVGVSTVVIVGGADAWSPKVIQASAGTIALVSVFLLDWGTLLSAKRSLSLASLVIKGGVSPSEIPANTLLVVGNEAHGIPKEHVAETEYKISLSMPGKTESLNAAIAASIALYGVFVHK